ncbi:MAG: hypothetical protein IJ573_03175 [Clostridia bacterium]|nr:hypothetical protein [Clostridia bacterium]
MFVVARDGSGDFTDIQEAIDRIPEGDRAPTLLLIRKGVYTGRVVIHKDNLRIVGEDRKETVLTASGCAKDPAPDGTPRGTFLSATLIVTGKNVEVENLTVRNDAGDGSTAGQAVAVYAAGDRGVWRNCDLIAHQDTLFCGPVMEKVNADTAPRISSAECVPSVGDSPVTHGRLYFEDCFIRGDIDFIFGPYRCWFERCTLFMNRHGGYYTAANTPEHQPYGMVFHRCTLTGECAAGAAFLGRPWRRFARTVFLECRMDACVAPCGFCDWDEERRVTDRCGEWRTEGARASLEMRHPGERQLTDEEAQILNLPEVIGGFDGWRPDRRVPTWFLCGDSTMADYPAEAYPMTGWGQKLQALTDGTVFIQNEAVNGRSSKSFITEQRLHYIECCLRAGDKLIVCFGHNDEKPDKARHTDPESTYRECLGLYIDTARQKGVEPILVTSIARRRFDASGKPVPTHGAYPSAMRRTAESLGVRLVDLESATTELLSGEGPEGSKSIYCHVPAGSPNYPEGRADDSHLQERGAVRIAKLFLDGLAGKQWRPGGASQDAGDGLEELILREDDVVKDKGC